MNYNSGAEIREFLAKNGLAMSKKLGQNFLLDLNVKIKIAKAVMGFGPSSVWEIGPGIGSLTSVLLNEKKNEINMTLFELDYGFCKLLKETIITDNPKVVLQEGDFLQTLKEHLNDYPEVIVGNLPYNVGSVCIMEIIKSFMKPKRLVFMLQKEVVQRITAKPGSSSFSVFSLYSQLEWDVKQLFLVGPSSFYPRPDVTSAVVQFDRKEEDFPNKADYFTLVDDLFRSRRKTIRNNLKKSKISMKFPEEKIMDAFAGIDLGLRAEKLSVEVFKSIIIKLHS